MHTHFYIIMPTFRTYWTPLYSDNEALKEAVEGHLEDLYFSGINSMPAKCRKCIELSRDYVEK